MFKIWKPIELFLMIKLNSKKEPKGVILGHILNILAFLGGNALRVNHKFVPKNKCITNMIICSKLKCWWDVLETLNTRIKF